MVEDNQSLGRLNTLTGNTLIMGIGQILKGDDGIGPLLCQKITGKISTDIIEAGTVPENYIQPVVKKAPKNLLIIDAVDFEAEPGTIRLFLPEQISYAAFSTHTLSPRLFINLIKEQLDVDVYLIGVQPANLEFGQSLSQSVSKALDTLVEVLINIFPIQQSAPDISES
ncbi:MAG: hydrogenase 3 maturation endopeptidase HyCI [Planctomycetota bacterium]|jgi:hydrogenase 3 maturation protease